MVILSAGKDIQESIIVDILAKKGIGVIPCDTIYGFVGIAPDTEKKISEIKGRSEGKKFLRLILPSWLSLYTDAKIESELITMGTGCITFVVKDYYGETTAVRFPKDPLLINILNKLEKPLYSTSVNRSGKEILYRSKDILKEFGNDIDLFLDAGDIPGLPSTILDVTSFPYRIIRSGTCTVPEKYLI